MLERSKCRDLCSGGLFSFTIVKTRNLFSASFCVCLCVCSRLSLLPFPILLRAFSGWRMRTGCTLEELGQFCRCAVRSCVSVCSLTAPPRLRLNHPFVSQVLKRRSGTLLLLLLRTPLSREVMQLVICSQPSSRLILGTPPSRPIYLTYPK